MGGQDDAERAFHPGLGHLREHVVEEGMPVPHAQEDRQPGAAGGQALPEARGLSSADLRQRRAAVEQLVVPRHGLDAGRGHLAPAQDVAQEGTDVGSSLRPAEPDQQHGVEGGGGVRHGSR